MSSPGGLRHPHPRNKHGTSRAQQLHLVLPPQRPASHVSGKISLPSTATVDFTRLPLLQIIFRAQKESFDARIPRIDDLYGTTKGQIRHLSVVSNCDLDVLKGFVAGGLAPVVLLRHGNKRRFWALVGYDDASEQIQLANPATRNARGTPYADFRQQWVASGGKCVLVTPGLLDEEKVRSVLESYLSLPHASQVRVRSR